MNNKQFYTEIHERDRNHWGNTSRRNYEIDVWQNRNRNQICLQLLGDVCKDKRVLAVGSAGWMETELLNSLTYGELTRSDLIAEDGIEEVDAYNMPYSASSFDVIICRELIEHLEDPASLLREIHRVLVLDGHLLLTTPNIYNCLPDGKEHVRGYAPQQLLEILPNWGFKVLDKRGNVPNIFYSGLKLAFFEDRVLLDFQDIAHRVSQFKDSYYIGTQLFILAQKI